MESIGTSGTALELVESFLIVRQQTVRIGNSLSSSLDIKSGVSQGSILAPLLFLIYIIDFCNISDNFSSILNADDITSQFSHDSLDFLMNNCNQELIKIKDWTVANKHSLKLDKTYAMMFTFTDASAVDPQIPMKYELLDDKPKFHFIVSESFQIH